MTVAEGKQQQGLPLEVRLMRQQRRLKREEDPEARAEIEKRIANLKEKISSQKRPVPLSTLRSKLKNKQERLTKVKDEAVRKNLETQIANLTARIENRTKNVAKKSLQTRLANKERRLTEIQNPDRRKHIEKAISNLKAKIAAEELRALDETKNAEEDIVVVEVPANSENVGPSPAGKTKRALVQLENRLKNKENMLAKVKNPKRRRTIEEAITRIKANIDRTRQNQQPKKSLKERLEQKQRMLPQIKNPERREKLMKDIARMTANLEKQQAKPANKKALQNRLAARQKLLKQVSDPDRRQKIEAAIARMTAKLALLNKVPDGLKEELSTEKVTDQQTIEAAITELKENGNDEAKKSTDQQGSRHQDWMTLMRREHVETNQEELAKIALDQAYVVYYPLSNGDPYRPLFAGRQRCLDDLATRWQMRKEALERALSTAPGDSLMSKSQLELLPSTWSLEQEIASFGPAAEKDDDGPDATDIMKEEDAAIKDAGYSDEEFFLDPMNDMKLGGNVDDLGTGAEDKETENQMLANGMEEEDAVLVAAPIEE